MLRRKSHAGGGGAGLARVLNADQHQLQLLHLEEPPEDAAHRGRRVCPRGGGSRARPGQQRGTRENTRKVPGAAASESTRAVEPCGSGGWGSRARRGGGIQETRGQSGRFTCYVDSAGTTGPAVVLASPRQARRLWATRRRVCASRQSPDCSRPKVSAVAGLGGGTLAVVTALWAAAGPVTKRC